MLLQPTLLAIFRTSKLSAKPGVKSGASAPVTRGKTPRRCVASSGPRRALSGRNHRQQAVAQEKVTALGASALRKKSKGEVGGAQTVSGCQGLCQTRKGSGMLKDRDAEGGGLMQFSVRLLFPNLTRIIRHNPFCLASPRVR